MYACLYACMQIFMYLRVRICLYACNVCMHVRMYVWLVCVCVCVRARVGAEAAAHLCVRGGRARGGAANARAPGQATRLARSKRSSLQNLLLPIHFPPRANSAVETSVSFFFNFSLTQRACGQIAHFRTGRVNLRVLARYFSLVRATNPRSDLVPREMVLFIGTRFSNLYTSVHTPA